MNPRIIGPAMVLAAFALILLQIAIRAWEVYFR